MKRITVRDSLGDGSSYSYVSGTLSSNPVIIFAQNPQSRSTSITNLIEELATQALAAEFPGIAPSAIRFFEYYSPEQNPLFVWQEVVFEDHTPREEDKGVLGKFAELLFGKPPPSAWILGRPHWRRPLSPTERSALEALVAGA